MEDDSDRSKDWFDFHARTDEVIVPSQWVTRLDEANAVHQQLDVSTKRNSLPVSKEDLLSFFSTFAINSKPIFRSKIRLQIHLMSIPSGSSRETEKVDREAVYCSSALYKMRQNAFYQRLSEHQMRWVSGMSKPFSLFISSVSSILWC